MARKLEPGRLVIASHNQGKVREIRDLLAPFGIEPVSAGELGLPEPEETGTTFADTLTGDGAATVLRGGGGVDTLSGGGGNDADDARASEGGEALTR